MVELLASVLAFTVLVAAATALLVGVTVAPLYTALQLADARGFSRVRCTAATVGGIAVALAAALAVHGRPGLPPYVALVPLVAAWSAPLTLWVTEPGQAWVGGRAGRHE